MIDAFSILWSDLTALKRRWPRYLLTTLMSPLLYLVAFGWGLGRGIDMNGTSYLDFVIPGIIALTAMTTSFMEPAPGSMSIDSISRALMNVSWPRWDCPPFSWEKR
jgi:hypothetical protein